MLYIIIYKHTYIDIKCINKYKLYTHILLVLFL